MEGLIPFVIDAIRKSQHGRGGSYRCVSSDGSSRGGSGSRRYLVDYWELPAAGAAVAPANNGSSSAMGQATDARCAEEHALQAWPAAVVAVPTYRRK